MMNGKISSVSGIRDSDPQPDVRRHNPPDFSTLNVILFPSAHPDQGHEGPTYCHERLGGLLKDYDREAA